MREDSRQAPREDRSVRVDRTVNMQRESRPAQSRPRRDRRSRRQSALGIYLIILFAAAFLLLLMAFFQQQRLNSQATNDALKQSASAVSTIQTVLADNDTLREENTVLKEQLRETEKRLGDAEGQLKVQTETAGSLEQLVRLRERSMDLFWQIDEAYVKGKYTLCRELMGRMEAEPALKESLPKESTTDNGRFSPADRYQEIANALK